MNDLECPYCETQTKAGRTVCLGCGAEIVYGATGSELDNASTFGGILGIVVSTIIVSLLSSEKEWFIYLISGWILYLVGKYYNLKRVKRKRKNNIRFFRSFQNF